MLITIFEWAGSILGLFGAFLLATHSRFSRFGWVAFLAANIAMIAFAFGISRFGLLLQQVGFMATSLLGLYRAGMWPELLKRRQIKKDETFSKSTLNAFKKNAEISKKFKKEIDEYCSKNPNAFKERGR